MAQNLIPKAQEIRIKSRENDQNLTIHEPFPIWRNISSSNHKTQICQNLDQLQQSTMLICTVNLKILYQKKKSYMMKPSISRKSEPKTSTNDIIKHLNQSGIPAWAIINSNPENQKV